MRPNLDTQASPTAFARGLIATLLILFFGVLTGCQSTPTRAPYAANPQHNALVRLRHWQAEGKVAVRYGDQRQSANFTWEQIQDNYVVHLFGPFGVGATWIKRTSKGATLENAKTGYRKADTPEALMAEVLGWHMPLSNMQYWLLGIPDSTGGDTVTQRYDQGFVQRAQSRGWQIEYSDYEWSEGWYLPEKLIAQRDDMALTVIVKNWQLPPAGGR